jgi:hypothetical protein
MSLDAIESAFSKSDGLLYHERLVLLAYAYMADEAGIVSGTFGSKCHVSGERLVIGHLSTMTGLPNDMIRHAQMSLENKGLLKRYERNYLLDMGN